MAHDSGLTRFQMAHMVGELAIMTAISTYFQTRTKALENKLDALISQVEQQAETITRMEGILMRNINARGSRVAPPLRSVSTRRQEPPQKFQKHTERGKLNQAKIRVVKESSSSSSDSEGSEVVTRVPAPNPLNGASQLLQMVGPVMQAMIPISTHVSQVQIEHVETDNAVSDSEIQGELDELVSTEKENSKVTATPQTS